MWLALLCLIAHAQVQDPWGGWRTVRTEHYRLHYPVAAAPWALHAAGRLEAIRERVAAEVGHEPEQVVDVVVLDPFRSANGFALPFVRRPRMGIFPTPPGASSVIGHYRSWAEDLVVHEDAHLVHLLRPSRNPLQRFLSRHLLGITPMTSKSPPWVIEGYATLVEGRLTGYGRPNSDFRATLLRALAQEGRLPTYREISASSRFLGGAFRYLVGSAFLEWLEARSGRSLVDVWARMTARRPRSFDDAFAGVYGEAPADLYARFRAELTHAALAIEEGRPVAGDTLWLDLRGYTGEPALSPDGSRIAFVERRPGKVSRLRVYATGDDAAAEQAWKEDVEAMLVADPQDVAPVPPEVFPREALHTRVDNAFPPAAPRWMPDGSLLFASWSRDGDGWLRPDLRTWHPETGEERAVTRGADITAAEPHPDGTWAVGVRTFWGAQHLVRVDLATGAWTPITEPDPAVVYDAPRFDPTGERLAFLRNRGGWEAVVREGEAERVVELPEGAVPWHPSWTPDGALLLSLGRAGFIEVWREGDLLTRTRGGAFGAVSDGASIFYLSLDARGFDLHREPIDEVAPVELAGTALPVVRPPPPPPVAPPEAVAVTPERYGLGPQEWVPIAGASVGAGGAAGEVGVRIGDPVGRHELLVLGGWRRRGRQGTSGGALAWAYRGLPVAVILHGYAVEDQGLLLARRAGGMLALGGDHVWPTGALAVSGGGLLDAPLAGGGARGTAFVAANLDQAFSRGPLWAAVGLDGHGQAGGARMARGTAGLRVGIRSFSLGGRVGGGDGGFDLGGLATSLLPGPAQWSTLQVPVVPLGTIGGDRWHHLRASLRWQVVDLFVERHRLCTGDACAPLSHAGLSATLAAPPTPLAKLPGLRVDSGLSCTFEDPEGPVPRPCTHLSDYAAWLSLTWHP